MNGPDRKVGNPNTGSYFTIGAAAVALIVGYGFLGLVSLLQSGQWAPESPGAAVSRAVQGTYTWREEHTIATMVIGIVMLLVIAGVFCFFFYRTPPSPLLKKAKILGRGQEMSLANISRKTVSGRLSSEGTAPGLLMVRTMHKPQDRYAGWRDGVIVIMGPGAGKTTAVSIPGVLKAPGVVFITSNKRDIADGVRGLREQVGTVWTFDPQLIARYSPTPTWWWNPLTYVTDEVRAHKLAKVWMDSSGPANAKRDAYFDSAGPNLLAGLLLAAALDNRPITQVFLWLTKPKNREAIGILDKAGYELPAAALEGVYNDPDEQRSGVFGTAAEMLSFLNNKRVLSWVTDSEGLRPEFSPERFVRSGFDTMIALSKEGIGSTGPLTAALTAAVLDAAEDMADEYEHGRLPVPLVVMLDEAANVCRIQELPNLYSHYGSRGIFLVTILQSWAQGVRVWGEDGMEAMYTAATIRIIGAGQADTKFLEKLSKLAGSHHKTRYSSTSGSGKATRNVSTSPESVLDVDDLAALTTGEVLVQSSGARPFLGKTIPWFEREEMQGQVAYSIATYEPHALVSV
jgi:type IV secretory pathway TraG/TraD family ATPase VirD4